MKAAFSSPLASTNGYNDGFLRTNALLVVIFLSNEDDQSATADYGSFLDQIRPPLAATGQRSWVAQFMGVTDTDSSCKTSQWAQAGYSEVGTKYISLANQSGGDSEAICDADLRRALTNVKARVLEVVTHLADAGDGHAHVVVQQVLDDHHGVVALLQRLPVEVRGQPGQVLAVVPDRDGDVLLRGRELVADLRLEQLVELGGHVKAAHSL